jgi:hypothetical protein
VSDDGTTLYCGCDAAIPREDSESAPPAVAIAASNGRVICEYAADGATANARLLLPSFLTKSDLICVGSDGSLLSFDVASGGLQQRAALPGSPAAATSAPSAAAAMDGGSNEGGNVGKPQPSSEPEGAEFLRQAGYRGPR